MSLSNQDKNMCIVAAHKIIDDYIRKVVLTDEYRGGTIQSATSRQDMINYLGMCLCQAITKIEQINNPQYPKLVIANLNEYLKTIPQSSYHMIGSYKSSDIAFSDTLHDIFKELCDCIHILLPSYKGLPYENLYMVWLFVI